jgi:DNA-binding response OmpR family regulator
VLLDVMMPKVDGFEVARRVKANRALPFVPIIMQTALDSTDDKVQGLEAGADDYITKPFNLNEVAARVRAVLRRSTGEPVREAVERGNLRIDPRSHEAFLGDKPLTLAPKEFALLYFLARNSGQVFSREALLDRVWGRDAFVSARTVDVHVRWLRTHVEEDPNLPTRLITVRGVGYKFVG